MKLVIDLETATALGLALPPSIPARAAEIIGSAFACGRGAQEKTLVTRSSTA